MIEKLIFLNFFFLSISELSNCYVVNPGFLVEPTVGEIWPKPQKEIKSDKIYRINIGEFKFQVIREDCDLLQNGLQRYIHLITNVEKIVRHPINEENLTNNDNYSGAIKQADVILTKKCEVLPYIGMNETYELVVNGSKESPQVIIKSGTVWGILRGLESFSQSLYAPINGNNIFVNEKYIVDYPRYSHRGLLIDTSRHYIPLKTMKQILDGMEYNKLNVLHWHIVDDQSFPYQSEKFPELSDKGAFHPQKLIYSREDIKKIVRYATGRGIRVMPEFDTPGHTRSWGEGRPDLLTSCSAYYGKKSLGPMDPSKDFVYSFIKEFYTEIRQLFPEKFLHLGGDEVSYECWKTSSDIKAFMERMNITSYGALEVYFIDRVINIVSELNATSLVWQEMFDTGEDLPKSTIVHIWKGGWQRTMKRATSKGYLTLLSSCWYLDHISGGGDWQKYYTCEPSDFDGTSSEKKLILGGEACMWAEVVNEYNVISRIFPRSSAVAEVLWSPYEWYRNVLSASKRLEEHTCRMNKRGISAQPPNGPGYCL